MQSAVGQKNLTAQKNTAQRTTRTFKNLLLGSVTPFPRGGISLSSSFPSTSSSWLSVFSPLTSSIISNQPSSPRSSPISSRIQAASSLRLHERTPEGSNAQIHSVVASPLCPALVGPGPRASDAAAGVGQVTINLDAQQVPHWIEKGASQRLSSSAKRPPRSSASHPKHWAYSVKQERLQCDSLGLVP